MKDYTILAKFIIPPEQSDSVLRDPAYTGIEYAGCYLLRDNRNDRREWFRKYPGRPLNNGNPACRYVLAYEDYGEVFLPSNASEVVENELDRDLCEGYQNYTQALLAFQSAVSVLIMEMNTTQVQSDTQAYMEHEFERERKQEREQAAKEESEQRLSEDPPFLV